MDITKQVNMMERLESKIIQLLQTKDIRPTQQRIEIMKYLMEHRVHPTADMIYTALKKNMPTFSKTTVYNTLKLLQEKGALAALATVEDQVRYDSNLMPHGHFKCNRCGTLYDLEISGGFPQQTTIDGHHIFEYQILAKGLCRHCHMQELS